MQCRYERACQITSETRRNCPACRLDKCLSTGMRRDRLLTVPISLQKKTEKRRTIEENRTLALNSNLNTNEEQSQLALLALSDDVGFFLK
jgi:predicted metal-binding protein